MKKTYALLTMASALAIAHPSFANDKETVKSETKVEQDASGNYERKSSTERTDANSTTTQQDSKVKVDVDNDGSVKKTVESETSVDPKGLMNKSSVKTTDTVEQKDGETTVKHKKKVDGKTVEETEEKR